MNLQHVMHWPGHWGLGIDAIFHIPHLLHVTADWRYGLRLPLATDDAIGLGSWSGSLYAGFPLIEGVSNKGGNWAISQSRSGDTVTTRYFPVVVPAHDALVVEAGVMVLPYLTEISDPGDYRDDDYAFQLWTLAGGVRWHSFWDVDLQVRNRADGKLHTGHAKGLFSLYAHALVGHVGYSIPKGKVEAGDGADRKTSAIGWKAGMTLSAWLNGFGTLDLALGKLPIGDWYFYMGNTIPLTFLDVL